MAVVPYARAVAIAYVYADGHTDLDGLSYADRYGHGRSNGDCDAYRRAVTIAVANTFARADSRAGADTYGHSHRPRQRQRPS